MATEREHHQETHGKDTHFEKGTPPAHSHEVHDHDHPEHHLPPDEKTYGEIQREASEADERARVEGAKHEHHEHAAEPAPKTAPPPPKK